MYESLHKLAASYEALVSNSHGSTSVPALRIHVYSETDALRPTSEGTFAETGSRLRFREAPSELSAEQSAVGGTKRKLNMNTWDSFAQYSMDG